MKASAPMPLSPEFNDILSQLERSKEHYFITGKAGTGKSTLLQLYRNTTKKKTVVLAPTGIAALNVRGQTIHSFFGFPPKFIDPSEIKPRKYRKLYEKLDTIIIDEISMVRADMLDNIDRFLRINRRKDIPFGGVQMIFFGDLFQLPPVVASPMEKHLFQTRYESPYFFSSDIVQSGDIDLHMIELHTVYRQDSRHFIRILDNIRLNDFDLDDLQELNERFEAEKEDDYYIITLCSTNKAANQINQKNLASIDAPEYTFQSRISGNFKPSIFPTQQTLFLKLGAQVMFVRNDTQRRYVNGSLGIIEDLSYDKIMIRLLDPSGKDVHIEIEKEEWEIIKYKIDPSNKEKITSEVTGTFTQYPIRLAWAMTIHKSQGKTFNRVMIDLGRGAFEYGQTYVALSRCRSLQGIYLKKPLSPKDIIVDERIQDYYQYMRYHS